MVYNTFRRNEQVVMACLARAHIHVVGCQWSRMVRGNSGHRLQMLNGSLLVLSMPVIRMVCGIELALSELCALMRYGCIEC